MIVDISLDYLNDGGDPIDKAILIGNIIEHCHYIKPNAGIVDGICRIIEQHGTPHIKEIFHSYSEYLSLPQDMEKYLTTIKLEDFPIGQQRIILFKPSEILLENGPYEWNIYKNLIRAYSKHRKFGNVFKYLHHKVEDCLLVPENGGGFGAFKAVAEMKNRGEYYRKYRKKVCMVFDRDTKDSTYFDDKKKNLFVYLSGKDHLQLGEDDINTFDYQGYVWHMWWKHSIENYFPPEKYEAKNVDMREARACVDYDYYKFKDKEHGYDKTMMETISDGMAMADFESQCRTFIFHNGSYSEFCLLLLKIAKIV